MSLQPVNRNTDRGNLFVSNWEEGQGKREKLIVPQHIECALLWVKKAWNGYWSVVRKVVKGIEMRSGHLITKLVLSALVKSVCAGHVCVCACVCVCVCVCVCCVCVCVCVCWSWYRYVLAWWYVIVWDHTCRTYNGFVVPKGRDLQGVGRGGKATAAHRGVCSCRGGGGRYQGTVR